MRYILYLWEARVFARQRAISRKETLRDITGNRERFQKILSFTLAPDKERSSGGVGVNILRGILILRLSRQN